MAGYKGQEVKRLYEQGDYEKAYLTLQAIIKDHPDDGILHGVLAELEVRVNKNFPRAQELLDEAQRLGCPEGHLHRVRGHILSGKGEVLDATSELEQAVRADRSVHNLAAFANSLMKTDFKRAAPVWQEIVKRDPSYVQAYLGLAWIARRDGDWSSAFDMATKATQLEPRNAQAVFSVAQAHKGLCQYQQAVKCYQEADRLGYANKQYIHANVAECYTQLGDYGKVLGHAHQGLQSGPQDNLVDELLNHCKGRLIWLCGDKLYEEAYAMMPVALEVWPDDSRLLAYMAVLEMDFKNDIDAGKGYMQEAFKYNNCEPDLLLAIKGCLWFDHLNDEEEGISCLEKAFSLNPNKFNSIALAARITDTDPERAKSIYEEQFKLDPEDTEAIYGLAEIWIKQGKWAKGLELATKGCRLQPSNASLTALVALACFNLGRLKQALVSYLRALELGFSDKVYIFNAIAECYQKLDNLGPAREYARKALSIDPYNPDAKQLLSDLG